MHVSNSPHIRLKPFVRGPRSPFTGRVILRTLDSPHYVSLSDNEMDVVDEMIGIEMSVESFVKWHLAGKEGISFRQAIRLLVKLKEASFLDESTQKSLLQYLDEISQFESPLFEHRSLRLGKRLRMLTRLPLFRIHSLEVLPWVAALGKIAGKGPGRVEGKLVDALDATAVDRLVGDVARDHGRIDILVNAVGGSTVIDNPQATTEQLAFADWQKLIAFNLDGTFLFTHAVIPVMKRHRSGKIVNLASIAGRGLSVNSSSAYAAAKGGIIAYTKSMAVELGRHNILVNAVAPGFMLTPMSVVNGVEETSTPDFIDWYVDRRKIPLGRTGYPEDVSGTVVFLASRYCRYMTGQLLVVDGGLMSTF